MAHSPIQEFLGIGGEAGDTQTFYILIYFLPLLLALFRQHASVLAIGALNLLLGWTIIGWIVALIWSLTGNTKRS